MSFKTKWMAMQQAKFERDHPRPIEDECGEDYQYCCQQWRTLRNSWMRDWWQIEVEDAKAKAYLKAVQDAQAAVIRQRVQKGDFEGMPELEALMKQLRNKGGNGGALHSHYFVTVNCKPDVRVEELVKKVNKFVRRKGMVRSAEWVYEQRGAHEGELGKGLHCHILVTQRGDVFDGPFKRNTRNTFKTLVGCPDTHVDIRPVPEKYLEDKRSYMKGAKTEEGKSEKVAMDRVWRPQNNLAEYYTHQNGEAPSTSEQEGRSEASPEDSAPESVGSDSEESHVDADLN